MHPYYYDCPVKLLDKADPPDTEHATKWRDAVRKVAAEKKAARARVAALKPGDEITLRDGVKPTGPFVIKSTKPLRGYFGNVLYRLKPADVASVLEKGSAT
jgi:hypothetical protein